MEDNSKFTAIRVYRHTRRKVAILASIQDKKMSEMVEAWIEGEWKAAKKAGMVKDAMLEKQEQKPE